jgi:hypothetical protein
MNNPKTTKQKKQIYNEKYGFSTSQYKCKFCGGTSFEDVWCMKCKKSIFEEKR